MMKLGVGRGGVKLLSSVALALAVGLTLFFVIRYIQGAESDKITIELQDQTNQKRKEIRDAIQTPRGPAPDSTSDSLRYLRERQSD